MRLPYIMETLSYQCIDLEGYCFWCDHTILKSLYWFLNISSADDVINWEVKVGELLSLDLILVCDEFYLVVFL